MVRTVRPGSPSRESAAFLENQDQDLSNPYSLPSSPSRVYERTSPSTSPSRSPVARFMASPLAHRPIPLIPAPSDLSRAGPVPNWRQPDTGEFSDIDHLRDSRNNNSYTEQDNNADNNDDDDVFSSSHYSSPRRPLPTAPFSRSPSPTRYRPAKSNIIQSPFLDQDNASDTALTIHNASPDLSEYDTRDVKSHSNFSFSHYSFNDGASVGSADTLHVIGKDKGQLGNEEEEIFMAPPVSQPRRHKDVVRKEVKLVDGNLVLDCPIATKLKSFLPRRDLDEFKYMRYTAATCDANDFADSGFTIRPAVQERETEVAICVTMYNEDEHLFTRTMHALIKNISHLCSREKSRIWGKDGWKKIVVCIVSDGRKKIHPRVLDTLAAMGIYQDGIAKNFVNGKKVQSHIYEYTTQVSIDPQLKFKGAEKGLVPVQLMFCLKEENKGKLNSHRWFFNAFCPLLDPNVCVLVDVGTKPGNKAIYHLWKTFDLKSNVAGACGEIQTMAGKTWRNLLNPLVACQNFEYKLANMLDKPMESAFGFITVLPGAFSAYRYHALVSKGVDHAQPRPLDQYFKGESKAGSSADIFTANMYLAEDRILCWELVSRKGEQWVLQYVPNATAETDVPDSVAEFISQRRRWLNGSFFASLYSQLHFRQIWETDHSTIRKIMFHIEFIYQFFNLLFSFFSLSNFYLAFYFVAGCLSVKEWDPMALQGGLILFDLFKYLIIILLACQFVISLGNRPSGARHLFIASIVIFAIVTIYTFSCGIYFIANTVAKASNGSEYADTKTSMMNIYVSLLSTIGLYVFISFVYLQPWHVATCMIQYLLIMPSYTCVLQVYALCNTHDVSWGTKGENESSQDLGFAVVKQGSQETDLVVEVEIPAGQNDIDSGYDEALMNLRDRKPVPEPIPDSQLLQQDYYREVRTRVVIFWMVGNLILVFIMTNVFNLNQAGKNWYLIFILWSVAVLTAFRAVGSLVFLAIRGCEYIYHTKVKTLERADEFKSRHGLTKQQRRRNNMKNLALSRQSDSNNHVKKNPFHDSMSIAGDDEDDADNSVYSNPHSATAYSSIATESSRF